MANTIASTTQVAPAATNAAQVQPAAVSAKSIQKPVQSQAKTPAKAPQDTVTLSTATQTPQQEAVESYSQTIKEAQHGDHQAQRLLAKETAAKKTA